MKKSEYIAARQAYWSDQRRAYEGPIAEQVNRDVVAVEAAFGDECEWEPEDPTVPLPPRIEVTANGNYIVGCHEDGSIDDFIAVLSPDGIWDNLFADHRTGIAVMTEAARRYNSWPAILDVVKKSRLHEGNYIHALEYLDQRICQILDGEEKS